MGFSLDFNINKSSLFTD